MAEVSESLYEYMFCEIVGLDEKSEHLLEKMGYDVGFRLSEAIAAETRCIGSDPLDIVKFICKEFWTFVFRKKIDKLQTNHRGVFVLSDSSFKWFMKYISNDEKNQEAAKRISKFPCGLLRGALANLGLVSIISADLTAMPAVSFSIKLKS